MHALTRYRKASNTSAESLARAVGTSRVTIYRIERGQQTPSLHLVQRLVTASNGLLRADDFLPSRQNLEQSA